MVTPVTGCGQGAWCGRLNSQSGPGTAYSHACRCDVHLFQMHTAEMGAPSATMAVAESRLQQCQMTPTHGVPHSKQCMRRSSSASEKSGTYWALRHTTPRQRGRARPSPSRSVLPYPSLGACPAFPKPVGLARSCTLVRPRPRWPSGRGTRWAAATGAVRPFGPLIWCRARPPRTSPLPPGVRGAVQGRLHAIVPRTEALHGQHP